MIWKILGALLVLWIAVSIVGFVVKSLLWLAVIGLVLTAGTLAYGALKARNDPPQLR